MEQSKKERRERRTPTQQLRAGIHIPDDVRLGVFDFVVKRVGVDAEGLVHYALRGAETHTLDFIRHQPQMGQVTTDFPKMSVPSGSHWSVFIDKTHVRCFKLIRQRKGVIVPVSASVHAGVHAHVQLRSGVDDLLELRPLITASHP